MFSHSVVSPNRFRALASWMVIATSSLGLCATHTPRLLHRQQSDLSSTVDCVDVWRAATIGSEEDSGSDRKSTRLNSSHQIISYAVFCLKKKKKKNKILT